MRKSLLFLMVILTSNLLYSQGIVDLKKIDRYIPKGYMILDTALGDLNNDTYPDVILALGNEIEEDSVYLARPLLLLMGKSDGTFSLKGRNDSVVLCKGCGGVWGNPFEGLKVIGRFFSVEHYGGSRNRWSQIITFKYDSSLNDFVLHKDTGETYDSAKPDKVKQVIYRKDGLGKLLFKDYKNSFLN